jgi:hypothetical protein
MLLASLGCLAVFIFKNILLGSHETLGMENINSIGQRIV